jgi:hypothetical protein
MKAVVYKLMTRVEDHQVSGIKASPDIIYPNSYESFRVIQIVEGLAATTDDYGFTLMEVSKRCQGIHRTNYL